MPHRSPEQQFLYLVLIFQYELNTFKNRKTCSKDLTILKNKM